MRKIGTLTTAAEARTLANVLFVRGIRNQIERSGGAWVVWVEREDQTAEAHDLLERFQAGELDVAHEQAALDAEKQRLREKLAEDEARKHFIDVGARWRSESFLSRGVAPLTAALMVLSIAVGVYTKLGSDHEASRPFFIADCRWTPDAGFESEPGLTEIRQGQVWRLFTPMLLHFGFIHLLFNMLWLKDLGSMIERRQGWLVLLAVVLVTELASSLSQYAMSGPAFGGMSGVVYGLLGYIWLRGRCDPKSGYRLDPRTVTWMGIWLVLCMTGMMGPIANTAHVVGLAVGMAWGFLASGKLGRLLRGS